ncbi:hypothetical protein BLA29_009763 [Euroglyphus maynei]|uniref:Uncharacterized protein n=1 Tax=Euroglyphus maynei TaxID=6958 RepID=A0A1Y3BSS7_EURMA|nr:hypothetical protein BLA29_009763 [Euroglyphus maynei]
MFFPVITNLDDDDDGDEDVINIENGSNDVDDQQYIYEIFRRQQQRPEKELKNHYCYYSDPNEKYADDGDDGNYLNEIIQTLHKCPYRYLNTIYPQINFTNTEYIPPNSLLESNDNNNTTKSIRLVDDDDGDKQIDYNNHFIQRSESEDNILYHTSTRLKHAVQ